MGRPSWLFRFVSFRFGLVWFLLPLLLLLVVLFPRKYDGVSLVLEKPSSLSLSVLSRWVTLAASFFFCETRREEISAEISIHVWFFLRNCRIIAVH